jgi:hypothetical protein
LHINVKFCEKLIPGTLVQNVHDYQQWILLALNDFVQLTEVTDPAYSAILFGVMNEDEAHSLSCCGAERPILTRWSSSVLKIFKWI